MSNVIKKDIALQMMSLVLSGTFAQSRKIILEGDFAVN